MKINKSQLKKVSFLIISILLIGGLFLYLGTLQNSKNISGEATLLEDGTQILEVTAKNGYFPSNIQAKSDTPTILRIKTNNTYDCSAALTIPKLSYNTFLPTNGNTDVQILPQKSGTIINASCSMGMYGFRIEFV